MAMRKLSAKSYESHGPKQFPPSRRRREKKFHETFDNNTVTDFNLPKVDREAKCELGNVKTDEIPEGAFTTAERFLKKEDCTFDTKVDENCINDKSLLTDVASADENFDMANQKFTDDETNAKDDTALEKEILDITIEKTIVDYNKIEDFDKDVEYDCKDSNIQEDDSNDSKVDKTITETIVHAQIHFDQCQSSYLSQNHLQTIQGIIFRSDHLRRNVKHIEFGENRTYRSDHENSFDHQIWIRLQVDSSNLWENARSYIWKHLGQQEWKLGDGTIVTANRIHVKY